MTQPLSEQGLDGLLARVEKQRRAVWSKWTCGCGWVANSGAICGWCSRNRPMPKTVELTRSDAEKVAALLRALIAQSSTLGEG